MDTPTGYQRLGPLLEKTSFTSAEARALGLSSALINHYIKQGHIKRLARGIYQSHHYTFPQDLLPWRGLIEALHSVRGGTICLLSALALYRIAEPPREYWIGVAHTTSVKKGGGKKIVRLRNIELGKTQIELHGVALPIFDRERSLIDALRLLPRDLAIQLLNRALSLTSNRIKIKRLIIYATQLRFDIKPYLKLIDPALKR